MERPGEREGVDTDAGREAFQEQSGAGVTGVLLVVRDATEERRVGHGGNRALLEATLEAVADGGSS